MDVLKSRIESKELLVWRSLYARSELTSDEKYYYRTLEKGYEGELMFDQLTKGLQSDVYILNGLLFEINNSYFQIDTLLIAPQKIYVFDVKNSEGDYLYEDEKFRRLRGGNDLKNPLHQLERCETLLRQFLKKLGYHLPIDGQIVFINPEFTLYQAPHDKPIIFPTQLNQLVQQLNTIPSKLSKRHTDLADQLMSAHQNEYPFSKYPPYQFDQLKKGKMCAMCHSLSTFQRDRRLVCNDCGHEEAIEAAFLRAVTELRLLFPDRKITTNLVYEWCGEGEDEGGSRKRVVRILRKNLGSKGYGRWIYYE
jgi:hypothetical protein